MTLALKDLFAPRLRPYWNSWKTFQKQTNSCSPIQGAGFSSLISMNIMYISYYTTRKPYFSPSVNCLVWPDKLINLPAHLRCLLYSDSCDSVCPHLPLSLWHSLAARITLTYSGSPLLWLNFTHVQYSFLEHWFQQAFLFPRNLPEKAITSTLVWKLPPVLKWSFQLLNHYRKEDWSQMRKKKLFVPKIHDAVDFCILIFTQ